MLNRVHTGVYEIFNTMSTTLAVYGASVVLGEDKPEAKWWTSMVSVGSGMMAYTMSKWQPALEGWKDHLAAGGYRFVCQAGIALATVYTMPLDEDPSLAQTAAVVATAKLGGDLLEFGKEALTSAGKKAFGRCSLFAKSADGWLFSKLNNRSSDERALDDYAPPKIDDLDFRAPEIPGDDGPGRLQAVPGPLVPPSGYQSMGFASRRGKDPKANDGLRPPRLSDEEDLLPPQFDL